MTKKDWIGIGYVSLAIVIWGSIGSLVDYPLLKMNLYEAGSIGQFSTFTLTGISTVIIAVLIFKKVFQ